MTALELAAFNDWLRARPGFESSITVDARLVTGGASNHTFRVSLREAPFASVALRLQRDHGIFEPYDIAREAEVVRLLGPTPVPVPAVVGVERDAAPLGSPFAVYEWVDAPHFGESPGASLPSFIRAVATIHRLDWEAAGFGFLGVPTSPAAALAAELDLIESRMITFGCLDHPSLSAALKRLRRAIPSGGRLALCQGDINLFNYLYRDGQVVAVVDWEQARISDPRVDVGQLLALQNLRGARFYPADSMPFVSLYAQVLGESINEMAFFRARWLFELGVIHFGWKLNNGSEPWYGLEGLLALLDAALAELD